jgi:uncharacterized GH25 family protein
MKKLIFAAVVVLMMSAFAFAGMIAQGTVSAIDGNNVTFEFISHDMTSGDKIQMGFGAVGTVSAVDGNKVTVEFTKQYRDLDRKLKNKGRVQAENGGKDGKFTPGRKGC